MIHKTSDRSYTVVTLIGLTDQPAASLALLARSWNNPPRLSITGGHFAGGGYDKYQRAFMLDTRPVGRPETLELTAAATEASPLANPAFVIRNWGESGAQVRVGGKPMARGKDVRIGHEHRLESSDLVVWIKMQTTQPQTITIKPVAP